MNTLAHIATLVTDELIFLKCAVVVTVLFCLIMRLDAQRTPHQVDQRQAERQRK